MLAAMSEITFRDFAGALMGNDHDQAAKHLQTLLGVDETTAAAATEHFVTQMQASPDFMMKAMGMRNVVTSGDRDGLVSLLGECFALEGDVRESAADAVLKRYV
jgi:hypothetical protein